MAVPDYQGLMLPVLRSVADGNEHRIADLRTVLAEEMELTEDDLALKIRSGAPSSIAESIGQSLTWLKQAYCGGHGAAWLS